ncbi:hypothetical protein COCC4DRAFT_125653 [Bipolaris maydis ATCC 48331]|uniref:Uncharacterized protein n=2 Tax=Cochliobolus heterostrophus TaxID=5016 RepID=M2UNT8_COCH5|nr:uncharacterized protein COCC4DRAFT_125653 [Bipolaris maydis ATCC 48331]EMD89623.1 hypothetical protein COCHEDRAFT_1106424 [Bipolaris maydis C5]ENI10165.1 hypothetical protein COCC4DRAFT_125653 [Bipolaris maydis ATCC 48331]KAJ6207465.1 hypothetical protein PSV09DRAFT_1106424 [Bipolaris maydis]
MVSTNKFNASVAKPKPAVKQVKVVNRGSEIKQMTATADAVRKAATSSKQPSSLDPIPHKDPDSTHNAHTSGRILIGKNAASRIRQRNDAVGKTAGPISQPKTKKIATEKKDGLYNASSKPKSALPRSATSTSPRPDIVATEAATAKRPAPCQNSSRQRMANNAIRSLKEPVCVPRTHKPFNAPTAYPTENGIAAEPIKNDKLHTGNADNREQTQTQSSESKSPYPKDNGGGVKPVSRASSEDRFLDKKKGVEDKRGEKRKYGYIEAEDTPNKKVHLSGQ